VGHRAEGREAGADDSNRGLDVGPDDRVGVIPGEIGADFDDESDADRAYDHDTRRRSKSSEVVVLAVYWESGITNTPPSPNMLVNATFSLAMSADAIPSGQEGPG